MLSELMPDELKKACKMIGKPLEWYIVGLLEGQASFAYALRKILTDILGKDEASSVIAKIWRLRAKSFAQRYLRERPQKTADISTVGQIAKAWWEREFAIPYEIVKNDPNEHIGKIPICPYWEIMKKMYGAAPSTVYVRKALTETTIEEFKGIAEALGLDVEVIVEKLICCGDDECLFIVKRKEN